MLSMASWGGVGSAPPSRMARENASNISTYWSVGGVYTVRVLDPGGNADLHRDVGVGVERDQDGELASRSDHVHPLPVLGFAFPP